MSADERAYPERLDREQVIAGWMKSPDSLASSISYLTWMVEQKQRLLDVKREDLAGLEDIYAEVMLRKAAERLRVEPEQVRSWLDNNQLGGMRMSGGLLIPQADDVERLYGEIYGTPNLVFDEDYDEVPAQIEEPLA